MFWNEEAECMSKEKKEELQLERLQKTVKHAYDKDCLQFLARISLKCTHPPEQLENQQ